MMKADLHLHSKFSWDSKVRIEDYISVAETQGFGAIAITDHNSIESHGIINELQPKTKVLLVPGQEINTLDGHLLIYGWTDLIPRDQSMISSIKQAKTTGKGTIVAIAAHPYDPFRSGKGKIVLNSGIDGIETLNASAISGIFNSRAKKATKNLNIIKLGNSDSHRLGEFGASWTLLPNCKTLEQLLQSLGEGLAKGNRIGLIRKMNRFFLRKVFGTK